MKLGDFVRFEDVVWMVCGEASPGVWSLRRANPLCQGGYQFVKVPIERVEHHCYEHEAGHKCSCGEPATHTNHPRTMFFCANCAEPEKYHQHEIANVPEPSTR